MAEGTIPVENEAVVTTLYSTPTLESTDGVANIMARRRHMDPPCDDDNQVMVKTIFPSLQKLLPEYLAHLERYTLYSIEIHDSEPEDLERPELVRIVLTNNSGVWQQVDMHLKYDNSESSPQLDTVKLYGGVDLKIDTVYAEERAKAWDQRSHFYLPKREHMALVVQALLKNRRLNPIWRLKNPPEHDIGSYSEYVLEGSTLFGDSSIEHYTELVFHYRHEKLVLPVNNPTLERLATANEEARKIGKFFQEHPELKTAMRLLEKAEGLYRFEKSNLEHKVDDTQRFVREVNKKLEGVNTVPLPDFNPTTVALNNGIKLIVQQLENILHPLQADFPREVMDFAAYAD